MVQVCVSVQTQEKNVLGILLHYFKNVLKVISKSLLFGLCNSQTLKWEEILVIINMLHSFIPQTLYLKWGMSRPERLRKTIRNPSLLKRIGKSIAWWEKYVPRSQTDIGFSLPSVSYIIYHLYLECPSTPLTLSFHLSSFISSLTYNFVFTAPTLLLEPIIFVFAANVTRLVFPIKHSRARCLCYLSDYALFVFVPIFRSFANMKCLKG